LSQLHCISKRKSGQHLTYEDRKVLEYLYNQNLKRSRKERLNQKALAKQLGFSEATLSRELRRGLVEQQTSQLETYMAYSSVVAQSNIEKNWENKGRDLKIGKDHKLCRQLEKMLLGEEVKGLKRLRYSPEAIVMNFDKVGWPTKIRICARTIYHYVAKNIFLNVSRTDLPRKGSYPKRCYKRIEKRLQSPEQKRIDERPKASDLRIEPGHWEMDCIESVKRDRTCLLTLVDRCTRESYIFKMSRQTKEAVIRRLNGLERRLGTAGFREKFKSITVDNGSEFMGWEKMEQSVLQKGSRTAIYYAHAYCSWERGSNENLNGFIRYFIPKGTELRYLRGKEIKELELFINYYPRKILGGCSAATFSQAIA